MNTTQLRSFAAEARQSLLSGVKSKMNALGFKENAQIDERDFPIKAPDGTIFKNEIYDVLFYEKWMRLYEEVKRCGFRQVCEEGAYTWFNRLIAIRILAKNNIINPVLEFESPEVRIPLIVKHAHEGICPDMPVFDTIRLNDIIDDDNRITDQFAILIVAYCQTTPILYKCFGTLNDFTELLLPTNILASNGFLNLLNSSAFITDEDFKTTELIGWLYQFYISERKDEVFASFKNGKKAEANDIPAATQIFTPNWIVKYMVQNTLGRIWLDNNPYSALKDDWQYLVEQKTDAERATLKVSDVESLTFADLSCGSGHILGEAFDILFSIYKDEGFNRRQAITSIFKNNLLGIDIDTRAKQLSMFALLLKACQKDISFADAHCLPRVFDMPACDRYTWRDLQGHMVTALQINTGTKTIAQELEDCFTLMEQSRNLGSIMKFTVSPASRAFMQECLAQQAIQQKFVDNLKPLFDGFEFILALTDRYAAIAMNPPYMGNGNMNPDLSNYVRDNYEDEKSDLFAVFMKVAEDHLLPNAKYGMINMQSWMFLSSFEKLRTHVIDNLQIDSMLHLGPRTFDELGGEVVQNTAYVLTNAKPSVTGCYYRLVDYAPCAQKEAHFLDELRKPIIVSQSNFKKIPGCPIGYWVSEIIINNFLNNRLNSHVNAVKGLDTCDNNTFTRLWFEVSHKTIGFDISSTTETYKHKWYPYCKGGGYRKWYGLLNTVVNWENDGEVLRNLRDEKGKIKSRPQNIKYYFQEGITWSTITSNSISLRYMKNCIFGGGGSAMFTIDNTSLYYIQSFLNSSASFHIMKVLNPTLNVLVGDILNLPLIENNVDGIINIAKKNITISKQDWDAHETSWDFKENELIRVFKEGNTSDLKSTVYAYESEWNEKFEQLRTNEEELNRLFIDIYGLKDELSCEVNPKEVTILQQGEIELWDVPGCPGWYSPHWLEDNIISQFISYAIGCIMGRYRLDRPGLHIAHPNPTAEELAPYQVGNNQFVIDDDAIIPLLPADSGFPDCAVTRVSQFIKMVFGEENHATNMNFVQQALGKDLEAYFAKDFYADHKKRYQNRPIYWLFSSKKGAFQVLVYMHRITPYTVERIRSKYLLPYIERLTERIKDMNASILELTSVQARTLQKMERDLQECREYHDLLHPVANQNISIDLDDGVVVNYAKFGSILAKLK